MLFDAYGRALIAPGAPGLLAAKMMTDEALRILAGRFSRERPSRLVDAQGNTIFVPSKVIGDTLHVRRPARFRS
jgi:hypothetical protein